MAAACVQTTGRLNKEMAKGALEVVVEQLLVSNVLHIDQSNVSAVLVDDETLGAARTLFNCVMERLLCDRVMRDAERRNMFPVTIYSLSALLCEALALYKLN
jgi:hypothetical protein